MNNTKLITKEQLEFLVDFEYVAGIKPSQLPDKIKVSFQVASYKDETICLLRTPAGTISGEIDEDYDVLSINLEAAVVFIKEFGDKVKAITDMKCDATRDFFASDEPLRVLKALYESDRSKRHLRRIVEPRAAHELDMAI